VFFTTHYKKVYVAAQKAKKPKETANLWIIHLVELSGDTPQGTDSNPISSFNIKEVVGYKNLGHTVNVWNSLLFLNSAFDSDGCTVLDISKDPMNPVELGKWIDGDCHDSFAKRILHKGDLKDFLFSADGTYGQFRIIDITNIRKKNYTFQQIGTTKNQFTYAHQNAGNKGLIEGGFTQEMCGKNRKLRPKYKLKLMACTGKNGAKCLKKNCCRKAESN